VGHLSKDGEDEVSEAGDDHREDARDQGQRLDHKFWAYARRARKVGLIDTHPTHVTRNTQHDTTRGEHVCAKTFGGGGGAVPGRPESA
jgi:hypothetical protein